MVLIGPSKVELKEVERPVVSEDEVLVKVKAASICGTDIHLFEGKWKVFTPRILGHEASGEIVEVGKNVSKVSVGDRVVINPVIRCGHCLMCKTGHYNICMNRKFIGIETDGAFAEYLKVGELNIESLPHSISFEEGALIEPTAVAVHAIRRGRIGMNDTVAVLGAGPIGLCAVQAARASGAGYILAMDNMDTRLITAKDLGADEIINPLKVNACKRVFECTDGIGVDVLIEATGSPKIYSEAIDLVRKGGRIVQIGLALDPAQFDILAFSRKELELIGCNGHMMDLEGTVDLIGKGKINVRRLITHRLLLHDLAKGFAMVQKKEGIKVVINEFK
jgi:L-iditol 2-dehydrogenase